MGAGWAGVGAKGEGMDGEYAAAGCSVPYRCLSNRRAWASASIGYFLSKGEFADEYCARN